MPTTLPASASTADGRVQVITIGASAVITAGLNKVVIHCRVEVEVVLCSQQCICHTVPTYVHASRADANFETDSCIRYRRLS